MNRLLCMVLTRLRVHEPRALSADAYGYTVLAVLLLATALGLQATVLAMIVFGPLAPPIPPETLTQMGRSNMRPEWDLPAFYAGCLLTVALCFVAVRLWSARLARPDGARAAWGGAALHAALAAASLAAFVALAEAARVDFDERLRLPASATLRLALPALLSLAVWAGYHLRARLRPAGAKRARS